MLSNKPVYLGLSVLELSETVMYEFWYDYVQPKYGEKAKLFCIDRDSLIVYIRTADIYKDIAENVKTKFDTLNYELNTPLLNRQNKKVIGIMKDELDGKIMKESFWIKSKIL